MFSVGIIVVAVSSLRLAGLVRTSHTRNGTWDYWDAGLWSTAEIFVSIICACLPAAKLVGQRSWQSINTKLLGTDVKTTSNSSIVPMHRVSPVLTTNSNQISLRTSITVSSPQQRSEDHSKCASDPNPEDSFDGGVVGFNCRTSTICTAGTLPNHPW
jgi:hypothetical protein